MPSFRRSSISGLQWTMSRKKRRSPHGDEGDDERLSQDSRRGDARRRRKSRRAISANSHGPQNSIMGT